MRINPLCACPQVSVGHIVPDGSAHVDARLRTGDEIISVDGLSVVGSSHRKVVAMMGQSALRGVVTLGVRRRLNPTAASGEKRSASVLPPSSWALTKFCLVLCACLRRCTRVQTESHSQCSQRHCTQANSLKLDGAAAPSEDFMSKHARQDNTDIILCSCSEHFVVVPV